MSYHIFKEKDVFKSEASAEGKLCVYISCRVNKWKESFLNSFQVLWINLKRQTAAELGCIFPAFCDANVLWQSLMLSIAKGLLEEEDREREEERERYMDECCPPLSVPRTLQELQVRVKPTVESPLPQHHHTVFVDMHNLHKSPRTGVMGRGKCKNWEC